MLVHYARDDLTDRFNFEVMYDKSKYDGNYVGVGLSTDEAMGNDAVVMCKESSPGVMSVSNYWNIEDPKFSLPLVSICISEKGFGLFLSWFLRKLFDIAGNH